METYKPLLKDADGEDVDEHMYRSMTGSLMYLTSSRPDIMFAVCVYARFQVNPKVLHLYAVKIIFRYLKGQPKLGLWYLKDSPFDLVAYTNSDYAGASLDRKSTIGAEYIATSNCCGQTKHIEIRHHFIRDSNEKKLIQLIKIHTDQNIADLLTKAFDKGIGVNAGDSKLMLLGINLLLLEKVNAARHNLLLLVNIWQMREDRLKLKELMDLYTKLSNRVLDLETTKTAQAKEIASLKKRVKKMERKRKSKTLGMNLFKIDMDEVFKDVKGDAEQVISATVDEVPTGDAVNTAGTKVNTTSALVTTIGVSVSTAEPITAASVNITTAEPITPPTTTTTTFFENEDLTIAQTLVEE
ncbi:hypothetical protein Tco_1320033 [Tanacetum coccineum]